MSHLFISGTSSSSFFLKPVVKFSGKKNQIKNISCGGSHTAISLENGKIIIFIQKKFSEMKKNIKSNQDNFSENFEEKKFNQFNGKQILMLSSGATSLLALVEGSVYLLDFSFNFPNKFEKINFGKQFKKYLSNCCWKGHLFAWGNNNCGQLGTGNQEEQKNPIEIEIKNAGPISEVAAGGQHSLVLTTYSQLFSCGKNQYGQLGHGNKKDKSTFTEVLFIPQKERIKSITCGNEISLILTENGKVFIAGRGNGTGLGNLEDQPIFQECIFGKNVEITQFSSGGAYGQSFFVAKSILSNIYGAGGNQYSQIKNNQDEKSELSPVRIPFPDEFIPISFACDENQEEFLGNFAQLPNEIIFKILSYLDAEFLTRISRCSKLFKVYANQNIFWKSLFKKFCGKPNPLELKIIENPQNLDCGYYEACLFRYNNPVYLSNDGKYKIFKWKAKKEGRLLTLGLDAGGKTTMLYKIKLWSNITTIPTIGFNVENFQAFGFEFNIWDVGVADKGRPLWRHYFQGTDCLIFPIDANDDQRFEEALSEIYRCAQSEQLSNSLFLFPFTKIDIAKNFSLIERIKQFDFKRIPQYHNFLNICTPRAEGLYELIFWIAEHI
ncbi:regulator of chromosome condensation [Anaeramoeba ignava]|uniref:Regulator of chromosome condensation n=1 Tax=Anaeramoeba ignava TaxID=1746090 RepID=A0A9Q0LTD8_ANAIG|nr:regulator of chromosome condensation [Anaeramoeba ignava]